jgi:hypothetical protein
MLIEQKTKDMAMEIYKKVKIKDIYKLTYFKRDFIPPKSPPIQ